MQNGTVSAQTALDHSGVEAPAVNGVLTSDGDLASAVAEEDAAVSVLTMS